MVVAIERELIIILQLHVSSKIEVVEVQESLAAVSKEPAYVHQTLVCYKETQW